LARGRDDVDLAAVHQARQHRAELKASLRAPCLDEAFDLQRLHDALHRGACQSDPAGDLGQAQAAGVIAQCAQHRRRPGDDLDACATVRPNVHAVSWAMGSAVGDVGPLQNYNFGTLYRNTVYARHHHPIGRATSTPPPGICMTTGFPLPMAAIAALALLSAVAPLATDMYLPAFPVMAEQLGASAAGIQVTLTAFLAGLAGGQLLIG